VGEGGARSAPGEGSDLLQLELCKQVFQDRISLLQDIVVPVPEYLKSLACQGCITPLVPFGICVLAAVDLNDDSSLETDEVEDIVLEGGLAAKLYP
jgi:hypothetical protein